MEQLMDIPIKLQNIYYETSDNELGVFYTNEKERITKKQAEEILTENEIDYLSVFKVRKEDVYIQLTIDQIQEFKK